MPHAPTLFAPVDSCSVACFKKHKEGQCTTPALLSQALDAQREREQQQKQAERDKAAQSSAQPSATAATAAPPSSSSDGSSSSSAAQEGVLFKPRETESTYTVSDAQLRALWQNTAVVEALRDGRLVQLLREIDAPCDPRMRERALDDAVAHNPDFAAFVNTVLQTIGVRDIEGNCTLT